MTKILVWLLWALSALPFLVVCLEFGHRRVGSCGNEAWFYARLYPHTFLYPISFGLISTYFLRFPCAKIVRRIRFLPKRSGVVTFICVVIVAVTIFASIVEFSEAPRAIWEFSPRVLDSDIGAVVRAEMSKICEDGVVNREYFEKGLERLDGNYRISWTGFVYHSWFVAMVVLFAFLFVAVFFANASGEMGRRLSVSLLPAFHFSIFWVLMKIASLTATRLLYEVHQTLLFSYIVFAAFAIVYVHLVTTAWHMSEKYERYVSIVVGLFVGLSGILKGSEFLSKTPLLASTFGIDGSYLTYIAVFFIMLMMYFPFILKRLGVE